MTLMSMALKEMKEREAYLSEIYTPFYVMSYALHCFNLENRLRQFYYEGRRLPSLRLHITNMAPSGFMKSYYGENLGTGEFAIFKNTNVHIDSRQTMCLPADQKVNMSSGELRNIQDIKIGDEVFAYDEYKNEIIKTIVTDTHAMYNDSILEIVLEDGRILKVTSNHPLYTFSGWKEAGNLLSGDCVAIPLRLDIDSNTGNEDIALIIGYMLGDGHFKKSTFYCEDKCVLAEFKQSVENMGCYLKQNPKRDIEYYIQCNGTGHKHILNDIFRKFGIKNNIREQKHVPPEMFTWSNNCIKNILRGLICSDGHIDNITGISFTNLSKQLCYDIQYMLLRFGIESSVWYSKPQKQYKILIYNSLMINKYITEIGFCYPIQNYIKKQTSKTLYSLPGDIWDIIDNEIGINTLSKIGKGIGHNDLYIGKRRRSRITHNIINKIGNYIKSDKLLKLSNIDIGWMKIRYIIKLPGEDVYNISTDSHTFIAQNIITHNTEAGLIGTKCFSDGVTITTEGVAEKFKNGILVVDEFSGVIQASKVGYNSQMESQLLALLDSGDIFKTLGSGEIAYNSQLTLWCGIQPGKMDLMGGIARRTVFTLFMPTRADSKSLTQAQYRAQNIMPDREGMAATWGRIDAWRDGLKNVNTIRFDESVLDLYEQLDVYCFEVSLFNRLALAYHLATHELSSDIVVSVDDKNFQLLALKAKEWRDSVIRGVPAIQLGKMIKVSGVYDEEEDSYSINKNVLIKDAVMLTWNSNQVNDLLVEMQKNGQVKLKGNVIELLSEG